MRVPVRVSLSLGQGVGSDKGSNHNKGVFKFRARCGFR